ncbi:MAG: TetR/AcrR family transcriptional regulator [Armatimonadota bacterium]|nr:TetR/AcrR family transcriptional regulator [Armatimonadota bacterium]
MMSDHQGMEGQGLHEGNTRERILRAAAFLFRKKGFKGTSMREIAEIVGINKSSLYHHIRGKQALLFEILQHTVDKAIGRLEKIARSDLPPSERLRLAVENHVTHLIEDLDNVACFIEEGKALSPDRMRAYIVKRDRYEGFFREIIAEGIRVGEFRPADVKLIGFAVLGMCNWVARWYRPNGGYTGEEIARQFSEFALRGILQTLPRETALMKSGSSERN